MARVFITSLSENSYQDAIEAGLQWINIHSLLKPGDKVFIKPNLTFPTYRKGVMTNPECIEQLVIALKDYTNDITVGEADSGGYNRFRMDEVFEKIGLNALGKRYGFKVVNLSNSPSRIISLEDEGLPFHIALPSLLFDQVDFFITVPVPKVHLNAIVSISVKNQWGLIQGTDMRLKLHPSFKKVIHKVNKLLPSSISIIDGKYGLTRSGPLRGDVVDMNWILISDNIFYADFVVTELMGLDYQGIPYLKYIFEKEEMNSLDEVEFNTDYKKFRKDKFYLKREWTDYPGVLTFHSRILAYVGYHSPLAKPLHWLLYKFREPFY